MSLPKKLEIDVLTLFPGMFDGPLGESLLEKARTKGLLKIRVVDLRDFAKGRHRKADDKIFGGGPGMLLQVEPIWRALKKLGAFGKAKDRPTVIYLSPQGERLDQGIVKELARAKRLILLCGHYEGIDERAMRWVDREISIGDYVLTGGEIPAMVLTDALARMVPGVVKERESVEKDSFFDGKLDCSHYSRPAEFKGMKVPPVLLSGNHKAIEEWRKSEALEKTAKKRPDLL
ncbi:MAG: tRNA (guanosine(37)-N1)-methyltransferase TrmD [Elusimicrobia bacterium RIFCSPLOWO2_01_FULL_60_11]|nr:MAG: tRNA (guanosine(37)-N1)-methyltransferase TrmD [Elusimicrobia bacterium RIFCSPLOWO2_01_FULL_60_11]